MNFKAHMVGLTLSSLTLGSGLIAAELKVAGTGRVAAEPEYFTLSASVESQCYSSNEEAIAQNNQVATQIKSIFKSYAEGEREQVTDSGAYAQYKDWVEYDNNERITLCEGWFSSSTLTVKLSLEDLVSYGDIQSQVLDIAGGGTRGEARTFYSLSQPSPGIYTETRLAKEKEALQQATADAHAKLRALSETCGFSAYKITSVITDDVAPTDYNRGPYDRASSAEAPRIPEFGNQWIVKSVVLTVESLDDQVFHCQVN